MSPPPPFQTHEGAISPYLTSTEKNFLMIWGSKTYEAMDAFLRTVLEVVQIRDVEKGLRSPELVRQVLWGDFPRRLCTWGRLVEITKKIPYDVEAEYLEGVLKVARGVTVCIWRALQILKKKTRYTEPFIRGVWVLAAKLKSEYDVWTNTICGALGWDFQTTVRVEWTVFKLYCISPESSGILSTSSVKTLSKDSGRKRRASPKWVRWPRPPVRARIEGEEVLNPV